MARPKLDKQVEEILDKYMLDESLIKTMKENYPETFFVENLRYRFDIPTALAEGIIKLMVDGGIVETEICFLCPECKTVIIIYSPDELKVLGLPISGCCDACEADGFDQDYSIDEMGTMIRFKWREEVKNVPYASRNAILKKAERRTK